MILDTAVLADLAARHNNDFWPPDKCSFDGQKWPCDAAALLAEVESLRKVRDAVDALMYKGLEERGPHGYPAHAGSDRDGHNILIPIRYPDGAPTLLWDNLTAALRAALVSEEGSRTR